MLKGNLLIAFVYLVLSAAFVQAQSKQWEKWVPLETTRAEIEAVLGEPAKQFPTFGRYGTQIGDFTIWYSDGKCRKDNNGVRYKVKPGVFTGMWFTPKDK